MAYGICDLAMVPLRAEPNDRSELVSQILFGETFTIVERQEKWIQVITTLDEYRGWIDYQQFSALNSDDFNFLASNPAALTTRPLSLVVNKRNGHRLLLPAGSSLPKLEQQVCYINDESFEVLTEPSANLNIIAQAKTYLAVPYLWGGRTHFGMDCSGLTQSVFRCSAGISLRRDAWQQAERGDVVDFLSEAQAGDLAFFDNAAGRITHVGILLSPNQILHASGRVKIDAIDSQGIYSAELKKYTHQLRIIKRMNSKAN